MHEELWDAPEEHMVRTVGVGYVLTARDQLKICMQAEAEAGRRYRQIREDHLAFGRAYRHAFGAHWERERDRRGGRRRRRRVRGCEALIHTRCSCRGSPVLVECVLVEAVVAAAGTHSTGGALDALDDDALGKAVAHDVKPLEDADTKAADAAAPSGHRRRCRVLADRHCGHVAAEGLVGLAAVKDECLLHAMFGDCGAEHRSERRCSASRRVARRRRRLATTCL